MREPLGIIVTTYNRPSTAVPTIISLRDNLVYDDGPRFWIIADDGSPTAYIDQLKGLLPNEQVFVTNANRHGVGASKNIALRQAFISTRLVLLLEDDWCLADKFNITSYADLLIANPRVGVIRLGYLSHGIKADLVGDVEGYGPMCYWRIVPNSDQYAYSGQISLRSVNWYNTIGYHQEGVNPGAEELNMCGRYNTSPNPPEILFPANIASHFQCSPFKNIGMNASLNNVQPEN
jgi:glycosyltransferase involved in cell wall biosynthesis